MYIRRRRTLQVFKLQDSMKAYITSFVPVCILTLCNFDVNCSFTENVSVGARDNKMIAVNTQDQP